MLGCMTTTLRDGTTTTDPRLDRLVQFDDASRGFQVRGLLSSATVRPKRGKTNKPGRGLDQGQEGECVLHGVAHWRNARPCRLTPPIRQVPEDKQRLREHYWEVQRRDPWEGGSYEGATPRYEGTSVLTAMQYGKEKGWWGSYYWAGAGSGDALGDTINGIVKVGGGVAGLPWFRSMFRPRPSGLMEVDVNSGLAGGHCIFLPTARLKMRLPSEWRGTKTVIAAQQSWGLDHGVADLGEPGGIVYFTEDSFGLLLESARQGEVAFPIQ